MAPPVLTNIGKLIEDISDMRFRDEAHIKISKEKRKIAYTMAVDLYINSIAWNLYENHNAEPSIKHYGYIQLVFQDAFSQIFPITQFRQRFYFAQQWEAMSQWQAWQKFYQDYYYAANSDDQNRAIAANLGIEDFPEMGITPVNLPLFCPQSRWIELPLREIHVKCQKNTQFTISYSQYQPVPFLDLIYGLFSPTGESSQEDGEKDDGIPDESIPRQNSPDNPFAGMPSPSTVEDIGYNGFAPIDPDDWEIPPTPAQSRCTVTVTTTYSPSNIDIYTSSIDVPLGAYFEVINFADPASPTGYYNGVSIMVDGSQIGWFYGDGIIYPILPKKHWSSAPVTVFAVCSPI